jgi:hypothetical protein
MPPRTRKATDDKPEGEYVKVGDTIDVDGNGIAVLPDGTAVTVRTQYTFAHEGLHVIHMANRSGESLEYLAEKPEKK